MLFHKLLNVERVKGYILVNDLFCLHFMFHVLTIFLKPHIFSGFFSEMLDGCRALLSMATVTTPTVFDQLLKSVRLVTIFHRRILLSFWVKQRLPILQHPDIISCMKWCNFDFFFYCYSALLALLLCYQHWCVKWFKS